jgi:hypothetical protein
MQRFNVCSPKYKSLAFTSALPTHTLLHHDAQTTLQHSTTISSGIQLTLGPCADSLPLPLRSIPTTHLDQ